MPSLGQTLRPKTGVAVAPSTAVFGTTDPCCSLTPPRPSQRSLLHLHRHHRLPGNPRDKLEFGLEYTYRSRSPATRRRPPLQEEVCNSDVRGDDFGLFTLLHQRCAHLTKARLLVDSIKSWHSEFQFVLDGEVFKSNPVTTSSESP